MRNSILSVVLLLLAAGIAAAQAPAPAATAPSHGEGLENEAFVGFLFQPTDWGTTNTYGVEGNYTHFFSQRWAGVMDLDYATASNNTQISSKTVRFGPRYNLMVHHRYQPYLHFLAGYANLDAHAYYPVAPLTAFKSWHGFTWAAGGGLDYQLTKHVGARVEGDWTRLPYGNNDKSDWQRLAFGAYWKW